MKTVRRLTVGLALILGSHASCLLAGPKTAIDASSVNAMAAGTQDFLENTVKKNLKNVTPDRGQVPGQKFQNYNGVPVGTFIEKLAQHLLKNLKNKNFCNGVKNPSTGKTNPETTWMQYLLGRLTVINNRCGAPFGFLVHMDYMVPSILLVRYEICTIYPVYTSTIHVDLGPEIRYPASEASMALETRASIPDVLLSIGIPINEGLLSELTALIPMSKQLASLAADLSTATLTLGGSGVAGAISDVTGIAGSSADKQTASQAIEQLKKIDSSRRWTGAPGGMKIFSLLDLILGTSEFDHLPGVSQVELLPRDTGIGYLFTNSLGSSTIGSLLSANTRTRAFNFLKPLGVYDGFRTNKYSTDEVAQRNPSDNGGMFLGKKMYEDFMLAVGDSRYPLVRITGMKEPSDILKAVGINSHYLQGLVSLASSGALPAHSYYSKADPWDPLEGAIADKSENCKFEGDKGNFGKAPWDFGPARSTGALTDGTFDSSEVSTRAAAATGGNPYANARELYDPMFTAFDNDVTSRGSTHRKDHLWIIQQFIREQANTDEPAKIRDDKDKKPNDFH